METNIIDSVIHTTRSQELVRQIIPILVGWAKHGKTDKTYGDFGKQGMGSCFTKKTGENLECIGIIRIFVTTKVK